MESAGSTGVSAGFSDDGSVVTGGAVDGSADGVDASGSSEGGAIDSVSVCVIAAEGEESGGVLSFASLHPAKVKQRIRDKNSGSKRFMMFASLFFLWFHLYLLSYSWVGEMSLVRLSHSLE